MTFDKGYVIDNENQRVECLIKNKDWLNNPEKFSYKYPTSVEKKEATVENIKEFGVYNFSKYLRYTVEVDTSTKDLDDMSYEKAPLFETRTVLLKVLVSGKATLLLYRNKGRIRYYLSKDGSQPKPLIYKTYKTSPKRYSWNNSFRQQLFAELTCDNITYKDFEKIGYEERELINIFLKYNECQQAEVENFHAKAKSQRNILDLNIRVGVNNSNITVTRPGLSIFQPGATVPFGSNLSFRGGLELEFYLPYNRNMWAILLEGSNYNYQVVISEPRTSGTNPALTSSSIEINVIAISLGLRSYFPLNPQNKLFANFSFAYNSISNSTAIIGTERFDLIRAGDLSAGVGYKFRNRFMVECRYTLGKPYTYRNDPGIETEFSNIALIAGFTIY